MPDELQALLERINEQGLKKAEATKTEVLDSARTEAKQIVSEAKAEADRLVAEAKREAKLLVEKGEQALRQAARDVLLSLGEQLEVRLRAVTAACVAEAMTPDAMAGILAELIRAYNAGNGAEDKVEVLLNEKDLAAMQAAIQGKLGDDLRANCDLAPVPDVNAGFKLSFQGSDMSYDFTSDSLAETLSVFLSPRLAELLRGDDR